MDATEHLKWCKKRAHEYVDANDPAGALASMFSDLSKHPETKNHAGIELGVMMMTAGHLNTDDKVRKFIDGFN